MVDLPEYPRRLVTTQAPSSNISSADILAPYAMFARAAGNLADVVQPMAEEAAAAAGAEAVGYDADGQPVMTTGPAIGRLGQIYRASARAGHMAALQGEIEKTVAEKRREYASDPSQFDKFGVDFERDMGLREKDPAVRAAVRVAVRQAVVRHSEALTADFQRVAMGNAKVSLETRVKANDDKMAALARRGGTDTDAYRALVADQKALYGELQANPKWGYSPAVVEDQESRAAARHHSEAIIGMADRVYDGRGYDEALKWVDAEVRHPDIRLSEAERNAYVAQAKAHLGVREATRREDVREVRALAEPTITALRDGVDLEADGDLLRQRLVALGDTIGAARVTYAMEYGRGKRGILSSPTREWSGAGAASGPIAQKVAAAAQTAGLPLNIVMSVVAQESGFNPALRSIGKDGRQLSSALGIFQLLKAERDAAGIGDTTDPEAQIPVGIAKMKSVYETAKAALGREPTAGEFYTVYYQGAGAGPKILANPGGDFAATVGEKVLKANPWLRGLKTNADFVRWSEQKMAERSAGGGASPSQLSGYRAYAATTFDRFLADAKKSVGTWHASDDDIAFLSSKVLPFLDEKRRQKAAEFIGDAERAGALLDLSPDARQALRNTLEAAAAGGDHEARAVLLDDEERYATLSRMEDETPLLRGARAGWIKPPPQVPWQGSHDQVAAAMRGRGNAAMVVTSQLHRPVSAFEGEDLRALTGALDRADVNGKVRILGALSTLPPGVREATFAKLHETGAKGAVLAFAGGLAAAAPDVAAGIVRGREALAAEPRFVPQKEADAQAFAEAMDKALPATAFFVGGRVGESGPYATARAAIKDRYADLSAAAGDTTGVLKEDRLERAADDVTGGTVRHNGATIIAPKRGMDQRAFDDLLFGLTDADLGGARTNSGKPITAQYVRNSATLEFFADGRYLIRVNRNAEAPQYAAGEDGRPFVLRLDDKIPKVRTRWGATSPLSSPAWPVAGFLPAEIDEAPGGPR